MATQPFRIVHTADWHIGKLLFDYSLLDDQRHFFDKFIEELTDLKPSALIVSGDIYDRSIPSAEAVNLLNDVLNRIVLDLKIPTMIIAGNHDSKERLSFGTSMLEHNQLYMEGNLNSAIKKVSFESNVTVNCYLVPYFELHHIKNLYKDVGITSLQQASEMYLSEIKIDKNQVNIFVGHGFFLNSDNPQDNAVGGSQSINTSVLSDFDYAALGHIHSNRSTGNQLFRYSGSPLKYSIDESAHQKSYTIIDIFSKNQIEISHVPIVPLHDVRIINGSFEWLSDPANHQNLGDYVFAEITDSSYILGAMSALKAVFPNILGLTYPNINSHSLLNIPNSSITDKSEVDLFTDFYFSSSGQPLDNAQLEIVKDTFNQIKKEKLL